MTTDYRLPTTDYSHCFYVLLPTHDSLRTTFYCKVNGRRFTLDILPGWKAGTKINYDDANLTFEVAEKPHSRFARHGNDLAVVCSCGWFSLLLGGSKHSVTTLDGRQVDVAVPPRRLVHRTAREGFSYKVRLLWPCVL